MATRAMFVLPDNSIAIEDPFRESASMLQYTQGRNTYVMQRIRSITDSNSGMTYEIYREIDITEEEALKRARIWNERNPSNAVPPRDFSR